MLLLLCLWKLCDHLQVGISLLYACSDSDATRRKVLLMLSRCPRRMVAWGLETCSEWVGGGPLSFCFQHVVLIYQVRLSEVWLASVLWQNSEREFQQTQGSWWVSLQVFINSCLGCIHLKTQSEMQKVFQDDKSTGGDYFCLPLWIIHIHIF